MLDWRDGRPFETRHGDWYASTDPLAEKQHVFINGCELPGRFERLNTHRFIIGETGFGFGTNFLLACAAWRRVATGRAHLHYVAFDAAPPAEEDLTRWHAGTGLDAADLIAAWPDPVRGVHRMHFAGNIHLTLVLDDINATGDLLPAADAWFLDGFSPAKNPTAWAPELLARIATRLRPGAAVTTYSAAASVRHALAGAGLQVTRSEGFGNKRHMTHAWTPGEWKPLALPAPTVAVLGGGIAGSNLAASLSRHGAEPILIDAGAPVPERPLAVFPYLSAAPEPFSRFSLAAFGYARRMMRQSLHTTGLFRIARDRDQHRFDRIAGWFEQSPDLVRAGELDSGGLSHTGLRFEHAGWAREAELRSPPDVIADCLLPDSGVTNTPVIVRSGSGIVAEADACALAVGPAITTLRGLGSIINLLPGGTAPATLNPDPHLGEIVTGAFTLIPTAPGHYWLGATWPTAPTPVLGPDLAARVTVATAAAVQHGEFETGVRCTTRDRVPLVGSHVPGIWLCTAFGSRGATHAPLAAEVCVSQLLGLPPACTQEVSAALDPGRFARRSGNSRSV